jgi:hypothetical protein
MSADAGDAKVLRVMDTAFVASGQHGNAPKVRGAIGQIDSILRGFTQSTGCSPEWRGMSPISGVHNVSIGTMAIVAVGDRRTPRWTWAARIAAHPVQGEIPMPSGHGRLGRSVLSFTNDISDIHRVPVLRRTAPHGRRIAFAGRIFRLPHLTDTVL